VKYIETIDFTTLFTMLDHGLILDKLEWLCKILLQNSKSVGIIFNRGIAKYNTDKTTNNCFWDIHRIMDAFKYLLNNVYVSIGELIFKQIKGIPMGNSTSPLIADLVLSIIEYQYLCQNPVDGYKLSFNMRYIDDILIINDKEFWEKALKIYPKELKFEKGKVFGLSTNFLDIKLEIKKYLKTSVYDKRNEFNFRVTKYIDPKSNVPNRIQINIINNELHRARRICSNDRDFHNFILLLVESL
jgi:hypothetical protein